MARRRHRFPFQLADDARADHRHNVFRGGSAALSLPTVVPDAATHAAQRNRYFHGAADFSADADDQLYPRLWRPADVVLLAYAPMGAGARSDTLGVYPIPAQDGKETLYLFRDFQIQERAGYLVGDRHRRTAFRCRAHVRGNLLDRGARLGGTHQRGALSVVAAWCVCRRADNPLLART